MERAHLADFRAVPSFGITAALTIHFLIYQVIYFETSTKWALSINKATNKHEQTKGTKGNDY